MTIKDLPHGEYMVAVSFNSAHKGADKKPLDEYFFLDGFRVYNTMKNANQVYTMKAGAIYDGFGSALKVNEHKTVSEQGPVFTRCATLC